MAFREPSDKNEFWKYYDDCEKDWKENSWKADKIMELVKNKWAIIKYNAHIKRQ